MSGFDRRSLIRGTIGASALAAASAYAKPKKTKAAPSDKVRIGVIGLNGMGWADMQAHQKLPDVDIVALCDVDANVLAKRATELQTLTGKAPKIYNDYRKLLADKDIDAVIVGTPDHWHCLIMTDACAAGKDVYCEKPVGNSIAECRAMIAAKNRFGRIVQVGQWQRSNQHWQDAIAYVQAGKLGRVRMVKAWAYLAWMPILSPQPDGPAPAGVDYDFWLGPAPSRRFNPNRFHFNFRWFWDYAGGFMTDWGVHLLDMALLGMKAAEPKSIMAVGGKYAYPDGAMETPDTQTALYDFGGFSIQWEHSVGIGVGPYNGRDHGVPFIGELGMLEVDRGQWTVMPEYGDGKPKIDAVAPIPASDNGLDKHAANFIACIKDRTLTPACGIEAAAHTATVCHMGNAAFRTGDKIYWDGQRFDKDAANALITPTYRGPWKLPPVA